MQKTKFIKVQAARTAFASLASIFTIATASVSLTSCAPGTGASTSPITTGLDSSLGCNNFEDVIWTAFNKSIEENGRPPEASEIEAAISAKAKTSARLGKLSGATQAKISSLMSDIVTTVALRADDVSEFSKTAAGGVDEEQRRGQWLERVAQLEIGDRTTDAKSNDVDQVRAKIAELQQLAVNEGLSASCMVAPPADGDQPDTGDTGSNITTASKLFDTWRSSVSTPVYGGLKAVATMYQSCEAATRGPLGSDVDVRGIAVVGKHSSGTGNKRQITNKSAFLASHPYVGNGVYRRPLPSCHDVQAVSSIYDYGGKPFTSSSNDKVMNFFKNAGTGTKELGIDCSGLVYASYATAGLKFKKGALKASLVNGISSTMMTEPQRNGLTCLDHAKFTSRSNLAAGDIISIKGHVVMVSDVGADPLGIASFTSASQCTLSNMNISRFNFSIFQSSPSKGGIGVNRMRAKDYLTSGTTMGKGMLAHAVNACKAKFQSGAVVSKSTSASVVRHLGTSDCKDSVPVKLEEEECLNSCSARSFE